jgi:hypothetical protein
MSTTTKNRRYGVAYLLNGKFSAFIERSLKQSEAVRLADTLNDNLAGSALIAVVIPHAEPTEAENKRYCVVLSKGRQRQIGLSAGEFIEADEFCKIQNDLCKRGDGWSASMFPVRGLDQFLLRQAPTVKGGAR